MSGHKTKPIQNVEKNNVINTNHIPDSHQRQNICRTKYQQEFAFYVFFSSLLEYDFSYRNT